MNKINLNEEIEKWNSVERKRLIIISNSSFDDIFFKKDSLELTFSSSFSDQFSKFKVKNGSDQKPKKYGISLSGFNIFEGAFYFSSEDWLLIDRKQLQEFFKEQNEENILEINKGKYSILDTKELTIFFAIWQKFSAISKQIEEKLKNKKISDSDREAIFENNFLFYMESCNSENCLCDHPVCVPQCSDILAQVLFHTENCFEKLEDAENFKNIFLADCSKANLEEKENISNSHSFSSENLSQSSQISTNDQKKLFEIDPIKALQNIIILIDEKLKTAKIQWNIILEQGTILKIEQLKNNKIVGRDAIIRTKNEILQEIKDKINEKRSNLSVDSYPKKSSLLNYFYYLIFISLGTIFLIAVFWKWEKKKTRK
ncbi:MAG: hypothetical protein GBAus27B_000578 [Mycoplasmataceae bacterium]|nr:MAG: hypothetical protein GBAus27B_000578 [Mycoplasmataceae bacterium]